MLTNCIDGPQKAKFENGWNIWCKGTQGVDRIKNPEISDFGNNPLHLGNDNIRFDVFYLTSAITRRLASSLWVFILKQSFEIIDKFNCEVLEKMLGPDSYIIDVWKLNKPCSSFVGAEIKLFISNIKEIVNGLHSLFDWRIEVLTCFSTFSK